MLEVVNITHSYQTSGDRRVVDGVNLEVGEQEIVALVGESGCGKTTLGRIVAGVTRPTSGVIRFNGEDIWSLRGRSWKAWRRAVQLIHQDPFGALNPSLTIESTLGAALLHHKMATRRNLEDELFHLLSMVGLDPTRDFLRRYPHQLSGGQRQRVTIARAVSLHPSLVVADEVTSMLDVSMRVAVLDLLLGLGVQRGIAYVFISHDLGVVRYFAAGGRVVVMFYGVVVEEGPTEEIIFHPRHPYSYLLLEAVPIPDPSLAEERMDIARVGMLEGEPSHEGCVFCNRCPFAEARCHRERPALEGEQGGHRVACFFSERVPMASHVRAAHIVDESEPAIAG